MEKARGKRLDMGKAKNLLGGWKQYAWAVAGSLVAAAAINVFLVPCKIAPGGVTGLATVVYYLSGGKLPVGMIMLAFNIPLFYLGIRHIGGRFGILTLFSTAFMSLIIDITGPFARHFARQYLTRPEGMPPTPDLLLHAVFGGFLMGAGVGLVLRTGATTGGTDLAARIINHFVPVFTIGQILLFIDAAIVILAAVAFKSFLLGLYAIVSLFVSSKVIDVVMEGVNYAKALFIISDKPDEIAEKILAELDRGVTALNGTGMYTGRGKRVLLCVVQRWEIPRLKEIVAKVDKKAFIVLTDIREVLGEGFKKYD